VGVFLGWQNFKALKAATVGLEIESSFGVNMEASLLGVRCRLKFSRVYPPNWAGLDCAYFLGNFFCGPKKSSRGDFTWGRKN